MSTTRSASASASASASGGAPRRPVVLGSPHVLGSRRVDAVYRALRPVLSRGIAQASRRAGLAPRGPRGPPALRVHEFIAAQWSAQVRSTLRRLTRGRTWTFIALPQFMERRRPQAQALARDADRRAAATCVVVDSLFKSSFWVLMLMIHVLHEDGGPGLAAYHAAVRAAKLHVIVDSTAGRGADAVSAGLHTPLSRLPPDAQLVLVDDAAYTGIQLSDFYQRVRLHWQLAHGAEGKPVVVAVPYVSRGAAQLLAGARLLPHTTFDALFHRRSPVTVLAMDLFLVSPRPGRGPGAGPGPGPGPGGRGGRAARVQSYLFDYLRLYPDQTMLMFEHKIADDVSIPYRWLHLGPCLPPPDRGGPREAYRVRPGRAAPLVAFLRQEVAHGRWLPPDERVGDAAEPPAGRYRIFAHRVADLMSSPAFRRDFMDRVPLTPARPPPPALDAGRRYLPLLPSSYCDERYRGFVARHLLAPSEYEGDSRRVLYYMPECHTPPYKTPAFRRALTGGLSGGTR
jgi:hypothetical protein